MATNHPAWAIACADDVWWSRLAQPEHHGWVAAAEGLRLDALERAKADPAPTALACYGRMVRRRPASRDQRRLRVVRGRPVSAVPGAFLRWCRARVAAPGSTGLFLVWANASGHTRQPVRSRIRAHTRAVTRPGQGVRIIPCRLPSRAPGCPIEPTWVHGKRAGSEPARMLSADELAQRVCDDYGGDRVPHVTMPEKVS